MLNQYWQLMEIKKKNGGQLNLNPAAFKQIIEEKTDGIDVEICEKHKISESLLKQLMKTYENNKEVKSCMLDVDLNLKRLT